MAWGATVPLVEAPAPRPSLLDRLLSVATKVEPGEGLDAILLAANVFLLLGTYYVLKTVREPLILNAPGGAEVKSYASAGQALLFLLVVPIYGALASKVNRLGLISWVTLFFISNLVLFWALGTAAVPIGVAFFLWVGIFNMLIVAQFWAFANDLYTEEQGKRLFPVVGVGASLGALAGSQVTKSVFRVVGPYELMLVAAVLLGVCLVLTRLIHFRAAGKGDAKEAKKAAEPLDRKGAFQLILRHRYLLLIAMLVFLMNWVNTQGEYIVSRFVNEASQHLPAAERGAYIGEFYGDYFSWVNLMGLLMQMFVVARIFQWIGVRGALFVLPAISLTGYGMLALAPVLSIIRGTKIMENATDYSLNNTVRHALYLPTSREAKYKAKAATDTLFVRAGDMMQAAVVFGGTALGFTVANFATVNVMLVAVWIAVAFAIYREHARMTEIK